jgi:Helitron helicase-like domain at N-terminus
MVTMLGDGEDIEQYAIPMDDNFRHFLRHRYKMISQDPVAEAQFFDIVFKAVTEGILGFGNEGNIGILGKVASHYAVIESQGKGTLHSHQLVWLIKDGILALGCIVNTYEIKV